MPFTLHFISILPATSGPHSQGDSPFAFSYFKERSFKMPLKRWLYEKKPRLIYDLQVDVLSMGTLQVLKVPSMMSFLHLSLYFFVFMVYYCSPWRAVAGCGKVLLSTTLFSSSLLISFLSRGLWFIRNYAILKEGLITH